MENKDTQATGENGDVSIRVSLDTDGPIRIDMGQASAAESEAEVQAGKGIAEEAPSEGARQKTVSETAAATGAAAGTAAEVATEAVTKASAQPKAAQDAAFSFSRPADVAAMKDLRRQAKAAGQANQAEAASQNPQNPPADASSASLGTKGLDPAWTSSLEESCALLHRIVDNVETVVYGKREVIELVLLAIVARGHVLIEDVPGVGKTSLVSALAKSISCDFNRIQFTPDVMPSDVSGFSIFNQKTREFEFRPGGVMANIVLADEINRASAKTQSSLLEAMEERQVTVDAHTYKLEEPFMVLATQNPIEQFGTYPLPEAQIDRFLIKTSVGYPEFAQEMRIINEGRASKRRIKAVAQRKDIVAASEAAEGIHLSPQVERYIVEIITATRNSAEIEIGSSPRGTIALADLSRAYALYQGRSYVIPDDIKYLVGYVLGHRISLSHSASVEGRSPQAVLSSIVSNIAVPLTAADALAEAQSAARK